jgi:hypothetical protein
MADSDSSSSSSSSSNNSSSSDGDGDDKQQGTSHKSSPQASARELSALCKGSTSDDSKQGESNHGKGSAEQGSAPTSESAMPLRNLRACILCSGGFACYRVGAAMFAGLPCLTWLSRLILCRAPPFAPEYIAAAYSACVRHAVERPSGDGGDTVLMSRNVPQEDKPAPTILKAGSARDIEIENEDDWAVPDDEEEGMAEAEGTGEAAAGAAPVDPAWEEVQRKAAQQRERKKAEDEKLV